MTDNDVQHDSGRMHVVQSNLHGFEKANQTESVRDGYIKHTSQRVSTFCSFEKNQRSLGLIKRTKRRLKQH